MSESKLVTLIENLLKNPELVKAVYETGEELSYGYDDKKDDHKKDDHPKKPKDVCCCPEKLLFIFLLNNVTIVNKNAECESKFIKHHAID